MAARQELYFPSAEDMEDVDLFGARFPLATPALARGGKWCLEREGVAKGKDPKMAALRLADDNDTVFNGTAQSSGSSGDQPTQHFALIIKGDKTFAVPVDWFYVFKPARKVQVSSEQSLALQAAEKERQNKLTKSFNKRFNIKDEDDEAKKRVKAVSQLDVVRKTTARRKRSADDEDDAFKAIEPELDELFAMDEELAEGWDFEDDVANNDIEGNVNREEAVDAQEEEEAELEREHEELEKILKKEGRVDKEEEKEDEGYKVDLDEDERGEPMPAVAASRLLEQEAEKEGRKHMDKLRKRVKQNKALLMSGLVGADSDDSMDSDEDDSDDPASRSQSPSAKRASTSAGTSGARPAPKRDRPDDMQDTFVQVKRANVPLSSLLAKASVSATQSGRAPPTSTEGPTNGAAEGAADIDFHNMPTEKYNELVAAVRARWPTDPLGQPLTERKLKYIIEVVKQASADVYKAKISKQQLKSLLQLATKGGVGKDAMFKSAGKGADGKSTFNIVL